MSAPSGDQRPGVFQFNGAIGGAAGIAVVAVLVLCPAARTAALDEPVGEKHLPLGVVELLHIPGEDQAGVDQALVDQLADFPVFLRVRGVVVVVGDVEALEIAHVFLAHSLDHDLRGDAFLFGLQHGCRTVGVVGANVDAFVAAQSLVAHPDVRLNVFQQVADMNRAIGVGQGGGDQYAAAHGSLRGRVSGGRRALYRKRARNPIMADFSHRRRSRKPTPP